MQNKKKLFILFLILLSLNNMTGACFAYKDFLKDFKSNPLVTQTSNSTDDNDKIASTMPFVISNNKFVTNQQGTNKSLFGIIDNHTEPQNILTAPNKILKLGISKEEKLYDEINFKNEDFAPSNLEDLNKMLSQEMPLKDLSKLSFSTPEVNPTVNRLKTVYFLTSLSTGIGQSTQIQDAFIKGKKLTGGGVTKSDYYGYENIFRNLTNPIGRAIAGAKVDDSGNFVNFTLHPLFGIGISSYMATSGASAKETFLVALADNFIFENVVEGTYVAPSGIDLLTTSGGCVLGYLASKYIFKKQFKAILRKTSDIKAKYGVQFDPIVEPGYYGKGMKIGSQIHFGK